MKRMMIVIALLVLLVACGEKIDSDDVNTCDEGYVLKDNRCIQNSTDQTYSITFDSDIGNSIEPMTSTSLTPLTLPTLTEAGYDFLGWKESGSSDEKIVTNPYTPTASTTLIAVWSINQYTISFDTASGSNVDSITASYLTQINEPTIPTKEGFQFDGWYQETSLTSAFTFSTMPSTDIILYAKWTELDWSVIEQYLPSQIPSTVSNDITLPQSYLDYHITWSSNNQDIISNDGVYRRPYQFTTVQLTAHIERDTHSFTTSYNIDLQGYKPLSTPLRSSYIYRDFGLVTDSFFSTLDIINCAFITADETGALHGSSVLRNINTHIMPKAREQGNWVLFSVAPESEWSVIAASASKLETFSNSIVEMINEHGFDGVDIDWETPRPDEAEHFTELMRIVYTKVKANNPNHLVTAAIAGGLWQPPMYDLEHSNQYLDYINMMTYGMVNSNGYYQNALYKSQTFADPQNVAGKSLTSCSIEESVSLFNSYGVTNDKIIVGVAFYGIKQVRSFNESTQLWSPWVKEGSVSYTYINDYYLKNDDYTYRFDSAAGVPYIISTDGTTFITYDNPRSIIKKSEYIIEQGLAGMMYWENGLDSTGALLGAMDNSLEK